MDVDRRDDRIERDDRLATAQRVEHAVLLVGERALELAGRRDDQRHDRLVAPGERRHRDRRRHGRVGVGRIGGGGRRLAHGHLAAQAGEDAVDVVSGRLDTGLVDRFLDDVDGRLGVDDLGHRPVREQRDHVVVATCRDGPGGCIGIVLGRRPVDRLDHLVLVGGAVEHRAVEHRAIERPAVDGHVGRLGEVILADRCRRWRRVELGVDRGGLIDCVVLHGRFVGTQCRQRVELGAGHHQRHGAGGRREVDELVGTGERLQLGGHVDRHETGTLEHLQEALATVCELLDVLAGQLGAAFEIGQHTLAVRARLVDHLATLLLRERDLGLRLGLGVLPAARRLDLGLLTQPVGFVVGLAQGAGSVLLGANLDLRRRLARGLEHADGLLPQQVRDHLVVELQGAWRGTVRGAQLGVELALAFLQPAHLGRDRCEEGPHLVLAVAAARRGEARFGHGRGRSGVGARERGSHTTKRKQLATLGGGNRLLSC